MKGWLLPISVTLGLAAVAAVLLWDAVDGPRGERPKRGASRESVSTPTAPQDVPLAAQTDPPPAIREAASSRPASVYGPASLEPLFTALAMHRPMERTEAADFTLLDLEGRPVRLREFQGKLVLLNFWATWCPPCRLEMPAMERLYQTFKHTQFAMLAVSIDRQGTAGVKRFMEELKLTFPVLLDSTMEVARQYGLRGLPTTYLIDQDGWLIGAAVGGRDWYSAEAKALIGGLLRQAATTGYDPVLVGPGR